MTGRKPKITPEVIEQVCQYVEAGNYIDVACAAVGISRASYFAWGRTGAEVEARIEAVGGDLGDPETWPNDLSDYEKLCLNFLDRTNKANARAEAYAVAIVRKHMPDQWTAAMTYLERRYPQRWKRRDLHEVAAQDATKDRELDDALLADPEAMRQLHEALARVGRGQLESGVIDVQGTEHTE